MFSNASDRSGPKKGKVSLTSLYLKQKLQVSYTKAMTRKNHSWKNDIDECYRTVRS